MIYPFTLNKSTRREIERVSHCCRVVGCAAVDSMVITLIHPNKGWFVSEMLGYNYGP